MPAWLVPALKAVGSLASGAIAARSAKKSNDRAWSQTKQMFGMQQADRDAQNRYNSPANMVARLKAAGLSPASYYGGAAQGAASVGSVDGSAPDVVTPDISGAAATAMDSLTNAGALEVNRRVAMSQIAKNAAETINTMYQSDLNKWDLAQKNRMQNELDEMIRNDVLKGSSEIRNIDASTERVLYDLDFDKSIESWRKEVVHQDSEQKRWSAFQSKWTGMVEQFQHAYMEEHGRQVPSDAWSGVLEYLLTKFGIDPNAFTKNPIVGSYETIKDFWNSIKDKYFIDDDGNIRERYGSR